MKLLRQKYKTSDGALKAAAFHNGLAHFEHDRGYKAKLYRYGVVYVAADQNFRVERFIANGAPRKLIEIKIG